MLSGNLWHVQADKGHIVGRFLLLFGQERQWKFGIDDLESNFVALLGRLEHVRWLKLKAHALAVVKILKKDKNLNDFFLRFDDLDPCLGGFPFLIDGHYHAPSGDGKERDDAVEVDLEARQGLLEVVQVPLTGESDGADGLRARRELQRLGHLSWQLLGDLGLGQCDGHVLLSGT